MNTPVGLHPPELEPASQLCSLVYTLQKTVRESKTTIQTRTQTPKIGHLKDPTISTSSSQEINPDIKNKVTGACQSGKVFKIIAKALGVTQTHTKNMAGQQYRQQHHPSCKTSSMQLSEKDHPKCNPVGGDVMVWVYF